LFLLQRDSFNQGKGIKMKDFLEFLNTAETEAIEELPGVTAAMAEKIAAARPFASLEDCSKVLGLTEKKIAKIKADYEKSLEPPVEQKAADTPSDVDEPLQIEPDEQKPLRKNVAGRIFAWILVLLLLAAAVYAVIRWGIPFIYEKYIKPVETNAAELTDLASQQSSDVASLNEYIAGLEARISDLESRADGFDKSLASHNEALDQLETMQKLIDQQMSDQKTDLLDELEIRVSLTRAIELLSRSRLYLSESNFGLAKDDLQSCRNLLYALQDQLPKDQLGAMKIVISRLDLALSNLPAYPVVAVYDVDTAWQYLVDGLPNVPEQLVTPLVMPPTETPEPTPTSPATTVESTAETTVEATSTP
jgi:DNA uptake protein ComE-like DNA-binding protein